MQGEVGAAGVGLAGCRRVCARAARLGKPRRSAPFRSAVTMQLGCGSSTALQLGFGVFEAMPKAAPPVAFGWGNGQGKGDLFLSAT